MERTPTAEGAELASYERSARLGRNLLVVAAICAVGATLCYATNVPLEQTLAFGAALTLGLGLWVRRETAAAELLNAALRRQSQGQFAEAEALLSRLDGHSGSRVRGAAAYQRGRMAFAQGSPEVARRQFDESVSALGGITLFPPTRALLAATLAHRAVAEASLGEADAAMRDAVATESSPLAMPEALALAALARVMVLDRDENFAEVESELARNDELLHEFTPTRMREILHRIERKLSRRGSSAYRTPADDAEEVEGDEIGHVARIDQVDVPAADPRVGAPTARAASSRTVLAVAVLWAVLIAMYFAIWFVLQPPELKPDAGEQESSERGSPHAEAPSLPTLLPYIVVPTALGVIVVLGVRAARRGRRFREGLRAMARSDLATARAIFGSLATGRSPDVAVARNLLAGIAYREAAFAEAIGHAEAAVAASSRIASAEADLLPTAKGIAAVARAASGDRDGALAALAALARDHAGFHSLPSVRLRVLFLVAVRDGDHARAKELLAERTLDMDLTHAEELLARIVAGSSSRGERERIERELARHPRVARWVTAVSDLVTAGPPSAA